MTPVGDEGCSPPCKNRGHRLRNPNSFEHSRHARGSVKTGPQPFIWGMFNGNINTDAGGCCRRLPECIIADRIHFHPG